MKNRHPIRTLTVILALLMLFSLFSSVFATEKDTIQTNTAETDVNTAEENKEDDVKTEDEGKENEKKGETTEEEKLPFRDVIGTEWFVPYVRELYTAGVVNGYPDGTFKPDGDVSVGELLKLLLLAVGYEEQEPAFPLYWSSGYYVLALEEDILTSRMLPASTLDLPISRLLVAELIASALEIEVDENEPMESPFDDINTPLMTRLYEIGLLQGSTDENGKRLYKPDDNLSRAEVCTIICRVREYDPSLWVEEEPVPDEDLSVADPASAIPPENWEEIIQEAVDKRLSYGLTTDYPLSAAGGFDIDRELLVKDEKGRYTYDDENVKTVFGIDVSYYQGEIDWEKVAADGVEFVMLRIGFRGYGSSGSLNPDRRFEEYYNGAKAAGLKVGVYFFSQAISVYEAQAEAIYTLELLGDRALDYPIAFDWEIPSETGRTAGLAGEIVDECAKAYCKIIADAGCIPMVYFNYTQSLEIYDLNEYTADNSLWFARYGSTKVVDFPLNIWQYANDGTVDRIEGSVDLDVSFLYVENVDDPEKPDDPDESDDPEKQDDPSNPDEQTNPEEQTKPEEQTDPNEQENTDNA